MKTHATKVQLDFHDTERTWTLWIESMSPEEQWIRLLFSWNADRLPAACTKVAEIVDPDRVQAFLEQIYDFNDDDAQGLASQIVDMLWTLATEKPPENALDYLRWRVCEWISEQRRRAQRDSAAA